MARPKRIPIRTKEGLFAKTLDGAPTPWIAASWIDPQGSEQSIRYRLWVRRRGGALHVDVHPESKTYAGIIKPVHLSRHASYDIYRAGMGLVRLAKWDSNRPPQYPRAVWRKDAPEYDSAPELARTVTAALPKFLHPTRGRPRIAPTVKGQNKNMPVALNGGGRAASKRVRRAELLVMTERVTNHIGPMIESMLAPRGNGYSKPEVSVILRHLTAIRAEIRALHEGVFYDTLLPTPAEPIDLGAARAHVNAQTAEGFDIQLPDSLASEPAPIYGSDETLARSANPHEYLSDAWIAFEAERGKAITRQKEEPAA